MEAMGRIAARRLLMLLDQPDSESWLTLVPTTLVVREST
jgi:DNA-binding LacI/PurR family transcriptional regulator